MTRQLSFSVAVALMLAAVSAKGQTVAETIIPAADLARLGLARGWMTQLPISRALTKISGVSLQADLLLVMTSRATLHVVDANSGSLLWSMQAGDPRFQSLAPTADAARVAVVNDSRLLVMDRASGGIVLDRELSGTPACAPTLLPRHVAIPLVHGPVEVYPLDVPAESIVRPQYLASFGAIVGMLVAMGDRVIWADGARIHSHQFGDPGVHFSERIPGEASTRLSVVMPSVYLGTKTGYVVAFEAIDGQRRWAFAAGSPMFQMPAAVGDTVYALPQDGGMFAVRADTGEELWYAPDPAHFVSATPDRVYTLDRTNRLTVSDARSGARLGVLPLVQRIRPLANTATDRLYLCTDSGFIQCAHEAVLTEPRLWQPPEAPTAPAAAQPEEGPPSEAAGA